MPFIVSSSDSEKQDVEVMLPGDKYPVIAGPTLRATKWRGGLWVMYVTGTSDWTVEVSDGTAAAGFMLFPSERYNYADSYGADYGSNANWTSAPFATGVGGQNVVTMICGGPRAFFRLYETQTLNAGTRTGADITYSLNDTLKISENGLLCNDSDADLATVGIANPIPVGIVSAVPSASNLYRLGADIKY